MLSNPSILDVVATISFVLGLVGQVSLFAFPRDRRVLERGLAVLFTVMVGGGVGLAWRAEQLRDADRDLAAPQFDGLRQAIEGHRDVAYQVYWAQGDAEAQALAHRIADAKQRKADAAQQGDRRGEDAWGRQLAALETEVGRIQRTHQGIAATGDADAPALQAEIDRYNWLGKRLREGR